MVKTAIRVDIRVIYGDTDAAGVVYHGNYLRYFEAGRNEYLRATGSVYREIEAQQRLRMPVVEVLAHYKQPARYDDLLTVETVMTKVGRASVRFEYRVLRAEALIATGHTVHACVDFEGRVQPLPQQLRAALLSSAGEFRVT